MKIFLFILSFLLLFSCKNDSTSNKIVNTSEPPESLEDDTTIENSKKPAIIFDASLTEDEWINAIWIDQFGGAPEEILGLIDLHFSDEEGYELFFIIKDDLESFYYTLFLNKDNEYELTKIPTSENSWTSRYAKSPSARVKVYELAFKDVNFDEDKEILVSTEIEGMTGAGDGDGFKPFKKIQFDVLSISNKIITHNSELTNNFNEENDVKLNEDSNLGIHEFLRQKYYSNITNDYEHEKMEMILNDMDVFSRKIYNHENEFQPVRKEDKGDFVIDLGLNFFECYFVTHPHNFETHELDHFDYPILYLSDHGVDVYSIIDIKIDEDLISLNLEKIYYHEEGTEEYDKDSETPFYVDFQNIEDKWILHYRSNYLMMQKDSKNIRTINSNEGQ